MTDSLYDKLVAAGCQVDNHESDLYVLATSEARAIVRNSGLCVSSSFVSRIDGKVWLDVPFAFAPWWRARGCRA